MITIFSTPKNFENIFNIIQTNAIKSWRALSSDIEIIIFGDSEGSRQISKEVGAVYVPKVKSSANGVPILPLHKKGRKFLMVGHRWDMDVNYDINFDDENNKKVFWKKADKQSVQHACTGIDYFIYRKGTFNNLPDFAIGRPGYDNWMLWHSRRRFIKLIDASSEIKIIHQNHHFNFHNIKKDPKINFEADGLSNIKLIGENTLNLLDTNYKLSYGRIKKNNDPSFINRNLGKLPKIFPEISFMLTIYKKIYRRFFHPLRKF